MRLIIGGKGQGKLDFALKKYGIEPDEIADNFNSAQKSRCFYHFEEAVRRELMCGENPLSKLQNLMRKNKEIIIICDEVGSGVVPIDQLERDWRETVGSLCCQVAEQAESVERIFCGLYMKLK